MKPLFSSNLFLSWKSFVPLAVALTACASGSAQETTLINDNFNKAVRVGSHPLIRGVDRDGGTSIDYAMAFNGLKEQATSNANAPDVTADANGNSLSLGGGAAFAVITCFAPTKLEAGDSISDSLNLSTSVAPANLAETFRIGLFDSNSGGPLLGNTDFAGGGVLKDDVGYVAFYGTTTGTAPIGHYIGERTQATDSNVFQPKAYTKGAINTATNTLAPNVIYPVTLNIARSLDGNSITTTSTFNGISLSLVDTTSPITDFDRLGFFFGSQFGGIQMIDDVVVTLVRKPSTAPPQRQN